jgi:uncharacterized spore protein YtfJ
MAKEPKPAKGFSVERLLDRVTRARLCYGEPVESGGRTVIPVSRVRLSGGLGFGRGAGADADSGDGSGGGGGGHLDAQPVGFIDVGPEGSTFVEIPDPDRHARNLKAVATAATALLTGLAGARRLTTGRRVPARRRLGR